MPRAIVSALLLSALVIPSFAQTKTKAPAPAAPAATAPAPRASADLPVRRVVLYKNGVGYFEHAGKIRGSQDVNIDFTTGQLNDVLKSLTVVDMSGGQITGVRYNSIAPLSERLRTLRVQLGEDATRAGFLTALRGARVEVRSGGASTVGKLLSVEEVERSVGKDFKEPITQFAVVTDSGEMRTFDLTPAVSVRVLEGELTQEIGQYMSAISTSRAKDVRRMTIATNGTGDRDLLVSYISEVPVWKSTYRIMLPSKPGEKALLQGWAIVDNTVGEDWKDVQLSLVAGAPQSFIQEISQPYYVRRPSVELPKSAMLTPQTHEGTMEGEDEEAAGSLRTPNVIPKVMAPPGPPPPPPVLDATMLKSQTNITEDLVNVAPRGRSFQSIIEFESSVPEAQAAALGDLFEYSVRQKTTVLKNQSALVPIVNARVDTEKVTLWSERQPLPLRAVWVKNTSDLTLDGGTFNIIDESSFGGEGILAELHPNERRLISYAADSAVRITDERQSEQRPTIRVRIARGLIGLTREERQSTSYTIRNSDRSDRTVVIEHPARDGWRLVDKSTKPEESSETHHRFKVPAAANSTAKLTVDEFHPVEQQYVLTNLNDNLIEMFVSERVINEKIEQAFRRILSKKNEIGSVDSQLASRRREIDDINREQARMRENMKALKGSAEEKALVQRYVGQMNQHEDRLVTLTREIGQLDASRLKLTAELDQMAQEIVLDEKL